MLALFEGGTGGAAEAEDASDYRDAIDAKRKFPVLADTKAKTIDRTPYSGSPLPGICVLSPEMEMVACYDGHGSHEDALELIADLNR